MGPKPRYLVENQAPGTSPAPALPHPIPAQPRGAGRHSPSVTALPLGTLPRSTVGPSRKIVSSPPDTTPPLFSVCRFRVSCVFSTVEQEKQQGWTKANAPQVKILRVISPHLTYSGILANIFLLLRICLVAWKEEWEGTGLIVITAVLDWGEGCILVFQNMLYLYNFYMTNLFAYTCRTVRKPQRYLMA